MKLAISSFGCKINSIQKHNGKGKSKNHCQDKRAASRKQNGEKAKQDRMSSAAADLAKVWFK